jgi:hypothetical protein
VPVRHRDRPRRIDRRRSPVLRRRSSTRPPIPREAGALLLPPAGYPLGVVGQRAAVAAGFPAGGSGRLGGDPDRVPEQPAPGPPVRRRLQPDPRHAVGGGAAVAGTGTAGGRDRHPPGGHRGVSRGDGRRLHRSAQPHPRDAPRTRPGSVVCGADVAARHRRRLARSGGDDRPDDPAFW